MMRDTMQCNAERPTAQLIWILKEIGQSWNVLYTIAKRVSW